MTANPWMKFFPADWRSDPKLRVCSIAARGFWMECLCLMHEADPYGHLIIGKKPPSDAQLAALTGTDPDTVRTLLLELEEAGVFSRTRSGVIYSRRMIADEKKAVLARKNGKKGGNPTLCNQTENPPPDNPPDKGYVNGRDKTHMPEAREQKSLENSDSPNTIIQSSISAPAGASGTVAYAGRSFTLNQKDFDAYRKRFHAIPDFLAAIQTFDEELVGKAKPYAALNRMLLTKHEYYLRRRQAAQPAQKTNRGRQVL